VEYRWVEPLLPKLGSVDVKRLSKGRLLSQQEEAAAAAAAAAAAKGGSGGGSARGAHAAAGEGAKGRGAGAEGEAGAQPVKRNDDKAVDAARQRYLQRKQQQAAAQPARKR
jgi:ATP-dependent RNA helicase DHX8/PRP22